MGVFSSFQQFVDSLMRKSHFNSKIEKSLIFTGLLDFEEVNRYEDKNGFKIEKK